MKIIRDKKNSDKVSSSDKVLTRLPKGMKIKKPKSNEIIISNNRVNTRTYDVIVSPLLYINHLPIPSILDIPLDLRYENMVLKEMDGLRFFMILISVDIEFKFSRIYYVFKRDSLNRLHYKVSVAVRQLKELFDIDEFNRKTSARIQKDQVGKIINIEKKIDNLIKDVKEITTAG